MKKFVNRVDAGKQLSNALSAHKDKPDHLILALPRGGVPVAYEIATALHLPLDVFLVRKLGVPQHEELAMGAIVEKNKCFLNHTLINHLNISDDEINVVIEKEKQELLRRLTLYRQSKALPLLQDKTVILVDDGIATGATIKAAADSLKDLHPKELILAVPIASPDSLAQLTVLVDQVVCLMTPEPFYSVGQGYEDFSEVTDQEVLTLLRRSPK